MSWKEQTIIRILLLVARFMADDDAMKDEIRHLSNHITTHRTIEQEMT